MFHVQRPESRGVRVTHLSENVSRPRVEYSHIPLLMFLLPVPISKTNTLRGRILNPNFGSGTILLLEYTIQLLTSLLRHSEAGLWVSGMDGLLFSSNSMYLLSTSHLSGKRQDLSLLKAAKKGILSVRLIMFAMAHLRHWLFF